MQDKNTSLCIAVVTGAHGVHGNVLLKTFTEDPLAVLTYKQVTTKQGRTHKIKSARSHKGGDVVIARFFEVTTRTMAEEMKGTELYINRNDLPEPDEEEFYHADLIGLDIVNTQDEPIGKVQALHNFGAGDLLEIRLHDSRESVVIPFTKECVPEIKIAKKVVVANLTTALSPEDLEKLAKTQ